MRRLRSVFAWFAAVLVAVVTLLLLIKFALLFSADHTAADRLAAAGAIVGGLIGAGGAVAAVYLMLSSQRKDEAKKVEASLRTEVCEFARLAKGPLDILVQQVLPGLRPLAAQHVQAFTELPEPVVFKATADRISRLSYGPLLVTFYVRIAEATQLASIYSLTLPEYIRAGGVPVPIANDQATTLATAWYDICTIARSILRAERNASQLIEAARTETVRDLDKSLGEAQKILDVRVSPHD